MISFPIQPITPQYPIYEVRTPSSQEGAFVFNALRDLKRSNELPYIFQAFEDRFNSLATTWKQDTAFFSSISDIASNKAYLQIIAMGEKALPLIFKSMAREPHHWFVALVSITGINPIKQEHRGHLARMTDDWLNWAKENNYYAA